jgi:hypothetical protein
MIVGIKKVIWTKKGNNRDMVNDWFGSTVQLNYAARDTNCEITHLFVWHAYKDTFLENIKLLYHLYIYKN